MVNHLFLITALEKYGFKEDFIKWIQILIQNQESCVINEATTTNYFKLERGTRQGNPISANTGYADDTKFFLKDEKSVIELMNTFDIFLTFSGLKTKVNVK